MKKIIIFFLLITLFFSISVFSQETKIFNYYFDNNLNFTDESKAIYTGIGTPLQGLIRMECRNKLNKLVLLAWFTDSTLITNQGLFQSFFENGNKEVEGNYNNGKEDGIWKKWDNVGYIIDSSIYKSGTIVFKSTYEYYENHIMSNHYLEDNLNNMKQNYLYDTTGTITKEEKIDKELAYSKEYKEGKLITYTAYKNGNIIGQNRYKPDGSVMTKKDFYEAEKQSAKKIEIMQKEFEKNLPEYPGGSNGFNNYIEKRLIYNGSLKDDIRVIQQIKFSFMLNEQGHPYDIKMLDFTNADLDALFRNILEHMPAWKMKGLKQYGPVIKAFKIH